MPDGSACCASANGVVGRRAAVEDADQKRQRIDRARAQPDAERRQRIGRPAARQVRRRHHRPAEHGVDEQQRVLADDELLVEALLPDLHVEPILLEEFLVVPQLPQPRRAIGLDAARGLQGVEVVRAQAAAVILERARVERAAVPAERAHGIELEQHRRQPVIVGALAVAAADIAEHFAGFLQGERHAVLAEEGAQAPHVAEEKIAALERAEEAERAAARLRAGLKLLLGRNLDLRRRGACGLAAAQQRRNSAGYPHRQRPSAPTRNRPIRAPFARRRRPRGSPHRPHPQPSRTLRLRMITITIRIYQANDLHSHHWFVTARGAALGRVRSARGFANLTSILSDCGHINFGPRILSLGFLGLRHADTSRNAQGNAQGSDPLP